MLIFDYPGTCALSGVWTGITAAQSFDKNLLSFPPTCSHFIPYTSGATSILQKGETLTAPSGATAYVQEIVVENGTVLGSSLAGFVFLNFLTGAPNASGETWTGSTTSGTILTAQAPISADGRYGQARQCMISVEVAGLNFTLSGITPTITAGTSYGHNINGGQDFVIKEWETLRQFQAINAEASNGAVMKYSLYF
jgi:hypothetical protein